MTDHSNRACATPCRSAPRSSIQRRSSACARSTTALAGAGRDASCARRARHGRRGGSSYRHRVARLERRAGVRRLEPTPTAPAPGQLAQAEQACGQDLGSPVLTDSRGPYTASIYANSTTGDVCLSGNGSRCPRARPRVATASVPAGQIQLNGGGTRDSAGNALTLVDGRTGAGVTAVTIERSDGSSVQATVANGWYLAWWPGTVAATNAKVTTASGTSTEAFPSAPNLATPPCPSGAHCGSGYQSGGSAGPRTVRSLDEHGPRQQRELVTGQPELVT